MRIRPATVADADGIARVHVDTWRSTYAGIIPADFLASLSYEQRAGFIRQNLANPPENWFLLVAETDQGEIVGFAGGGKERTGDQAYKGEIYAIYVLPAYQQQGIGRQLMRASVEKLVELGLTTLLIWALTENSSGRRFYERLGGKVVREGTFEIPGGTLPEVGYGWEDITEIRKVDSGTVRQ